MHEIPQEATIQLGMPLTKAELAARSGFILDFLLSDFFYSLNFTQSLPERAKFHTFLQMLWRSAIIASTVPSTPSLTTNSYAVPVYLKHKCAVFLVTRVSKIQSVTTPIPWLAVVAIILADAQILTFQNRVHTRVVSSTLH